MSRKPSSDNFDKEVIFAIEHQMLPIWEHHGVKRLAVSAETLSEFRAQPLPEQMQTWEKPRKGRKVVTRNRIQRSDRVVKSWPEDDQESIRFPVLIYVRSGESELGIGDYVVRCPEGHFLFLSPGVPQPAGETPHLEAPRQDKKCEIWWFHSTGNRDYIALSICYSVGEEHINSGHYYIVDDSQVAQLFHIFSQEVVGQPLHYQRTSFAALKLFLLLFAREIEAGRFYNRGVDNLPKSVTGTTSSIEMARQYIDKNLNHPLTIDLVAQAVFMARTNFTRQFREETGQTFRQYLTDRRLEEAKHWLLQEACSVEVVSQFVGLKHSRFHQLFQQRFGMTPAEFRKRHRNI